jgi:phosphonate transport system substrate-binding protein
VIGFTGSAFQDVTNTDIKAAVSVLMQKIAFRHFDRGEAKFYESLPEMAADLKTGKIQAMGLPVEEFMELRKMAPLEPLLVTSSTGGSETELLLLTRKDSNIRSIWDLKGKSIVIPPSNPKYCTISRVWLESILYGKGYHEMEDFFSSVRDSKTTAKALMPVFFRQADACVVTRQVLNLTAEMNPQISRDLTIIASKGKLAQGIIAVDRRLSEETEERIRQAFLNLHKTPDGEQLLLLFKVKKLIPIPSGYLRETEALYSMHPSHRHKISTGRLATRSKP